MLGIKRETTESGPFPDGDKQRLGELNLKEIYEAEASKFLHDNLAQERVQKALARSYERQLPFATVLTNSHFTVVRSRAFLDFKKSVMDRFPAIVEVEQRDGRFTLWTQRPSLFKVLWYDV